MKCLIFAVCFYLAVIADKPPSCITPNDEAAFCISLFSCPILAKAVASSDTSVKTFIEASGCGSGRFMVCCGTAANFINPYAPGLGNGNKENKTKTDNSRKDFVIKNLLPSKQYCGMQHTDDYFYNESATSIDEFPWMLYIHLSPRLPGQYDPNLICSGVLLNARYALTNAFCASRYFESVKIGQYHRHQNVSCVQTSFGEDDCTEPTIEVKVTSRVASPDYNLLLLRLEEKVAYTEYIRPICLPLEEADNPQIGDIVVTSGWGQDHLDQQLKVKKRAKHIIVDNDNCKKNDFPLICAATIQNSTSSVCDGDDGGPLMYKHNNNWIVVGIVETDVGCSNNRKFIAKRITPQTLEWIFQFMEP